jgi:hypothetical protein
VTCPGAPGLVQDHEDLVGIAVDDFELADGLRVLLAVKETAGFHWICCFSRKLPTGAVAAGSHVAELIASVGGPRIQLLPRLCQELAQANALQERGARY